jgi:ACS family hexuronate transporter-like MFS transporter
MGTSTDSVESRPLGVKQQAEAGDEKVPAAAQDLPVVGKYRWLICALLFLATSINYIDRQILSLLKPILDQQLGWSNAQFGMVNSAFQGAYAFGLLFFGWFIDRFGTKIGYAVSIAAWSLAAASHAFAASVGGFFAARMALGAGEGGNFPAAIKAVAIWFPKKERALATSLFNAGTNVGAILAPALVPWIALTWGWQAAFVFAGICGLMWLGLWLPLYNTPDKIKNLRTSELRHIQSDGEDRVAQNQKISWGDLLKYRQTWSFVVAKFLTDPIWWFFLIWLPDYFKQTRGLDIKVSWVHLVAIYTIVTVLSIMGGWVTGYLTKCGWSVTRARKTGMFIFALLVLPIYAATAVGDWTAVVIIGLAGAAHQAWSANLFTTVSDMFPKRAVASVIGIGGMAGAFGGMLFPIVTGMLLDSFKAAGNVTAGYALLFSVCAFGYLVAFGIHHLLAPKFEAFDMK